MGSSTRRQWEWGSGGEILLAARQLKKRGTGEGGLKRNMNTQHENQMVQGGEERIGSHVQQTNSSNYDSVSKQRRDRVESAQPPQRLRF